MRDGPHFLYELDHYEAICMITGWPYARGSLAPNFTLPQGSRLLEERTQTTFTHTYTLRQIVPHTTCMSGLAHACVQGIWLNDGSKTAITVLRTVCPEPMLPPTDVTVELFGDNFTAVRVSWTATPNLTSNGGYRVKYNHSEIEVIGGNSSAIIQGERSLTYLKLLLLVGLGCKLYSPQLQNSKNCSKLLATMETYFQIFCQKNAL